MKILIIGATHGNELLGVKLYERLLKQRSPLLEHVDFIVGNPRAYAARQRYIDSDLNRSYGKKGHAYEERRAQEITQYIGRTKPDLVLDMHTTTCDQPVCLIGGSTKGEVKRRFLRASHVKAILQVHPMDSIVTLGDNVAAYEVPNDQITTELLDSIIADLQRCIDDAGGHERKKLFAMSDKIFKRDVTPEQAASFVNFELSPLGFVPIMTGENSYKKQTDYLGFKSPAPKDIRIR